MLVVVYALAVVWLLWLALVQAGKRVNKAWLLGLGVLPVVLIYVFNPEFRVYSLHSFMHAGITYQILNGNIPPFDPLLAGHRVAYPWAGHLIAAGVSWVFNVTPFMSIAALNVISLVVSMVLVYRISKALVDDERANVLSVVVAIFGITFTSRGLVQVIAPKLQTEFRGVPILIKFININMVPMGVAFFLLFLYSTLRLGRSSRAARPAAMMVAAMLGIGFVYPAFLPGVAASLGLFWVVSLALYRRKAVRWDFRALAVATAAFVISGLIVRPYLRQTAEGTVNMIQVMEGRLALGNLFSFLAVALPSLAVIAIGARSFARADRKVLLFLGVVALATMGLYLAIHLPLDNEYKLMLLSTVTLGIPAGAAFAHLSRCLRGYGAVVVFVLLVAFLFPGFQIVKRNLLQGGAGRAPQVFSERGRSVHSTDREADGFYQWIEANTPRNSAIIDRDLVVPVLARRALFIGLGLLEEGKQKGYGPVSLILSQQSGYSPEVLALRRSVVDKIYGTNPTLTAPAVKELKDLPDGAYVVWRAAETARLLEGPGFEDLYTSEAGNFKLYRLTPAELLGPKRADRANR